MTKEHWFIIKSINLDVDMKNKYNLENEFKKLELSDA